MCSENSSRCNILWTCMSILCSRSRTEGQHWWGEGEGRWWKEMHDFESIIILILHRRGKKWCNLCRKLTKVRTHGCTKRDGVGHNPGCPFFLDPRQTHYWISLCELSLASLNGLIQSQLTFCVVCTLPSVMLNLLIVNKMGRWDRNTSIHAIFHCSYLPSIPTQVLIIS